MDQWKAILATMMIFGSGVGTGHLISQRSQTSTLIPNGPERSELRPNTPDVGRSNSQPRPIFFSGSGYLDRHLALSNEQKAQIQYVTKKSHQRITEFGKPFRNQLQLEHMEVQKQIRKILTPNQTKTFDNLPHFRFNIEPGRPLNSPENLNEGNPPPHDKLPNLQKPPSHPESDQRSKPSKPNTSHLRTSSLT
jgi:hypothetical protein